MSVTPTKSVAEMHKKLKRHMIVDRLNKHTIDTKLNLIEQDFLIDPYKKWKQKIKERESFQANYPIPYDADAAYE